MIKESKTKIKLRILSLFFTFIILVPIANLSIASLTQVYAVEEINYSEKTEKESLEAQKSVIFITGNWNRAKSDGLVPPQGYFHYRVQEHILKKLKVKFPKESGTEQIVTYKPGLAPKDSKNNEGRIDLYGVNDNKIEYVWELKPGSYMEPNKFMEGINQLSGYVFDAELKKSNGTSELRIGNIPYKDGQEEYLKGSISLYDIFKSFQSRTDKLNNIDFDMLKDYDISFDCFIDPVSKKYLILTGYFPSGMIIYWFYRIPNNQLKKGNPQIDTSYFLVYCWSSNFICLKKLRLQFSRSIRYSSPCAI